MTDDFNEFFDDNTHWVEQGSEPMRGAKPSEPPKSRKEMRKRRAHRLSLIHISEPTRH